MPGFSDPFVQKTPDRKLTTRELVRSLRISIAAEEDATSLYEAQADATDNPLAKAVLQDIANEERVHVGEFQRLISILLADEDGWLAEGVAEVNEMAEMVAAGLPNPGQNLPGEDAPPDTDTSEATVGDLTKHD
ncbi:MAG TPA: ferritin family protein [Armatimonadota bacterium]|jgi:rubrerythrin